LPPLSCLSVRRVPEAGLASSRELARDDKLGVNVDVHIGVVPGIAVDLDIAEIHGGLDLGPPFPAEVAIAGRRPVDIAGDAAARVNTKADLILAGGQIEIAPVASLYAEIEVAGKRGLDW